MKTQQNGGFVVGVEDLAVDGEVDGLRSGRGHNRVPSYKVEGGGFVDVLHYLGRAINKA